MIGKPSAITVGVWADSAATPTLLAQLAALPRLTTWACPGDTRWPDFVVHVVEHGVEAAGLVAATAATSPGTSVLLVYSCDSASAVLDLGEHAHVRAIPWPVRSAELLHAIDAAAARRDELAAIRSSSDRIDAALARLSDREWEVLGLLRRGAPSKSVAHTLHLSKRTIDDHRRSMLAKSGYDSITALMDDVSRRELLRERSSRLTDQRWRPGTRPEGDRAASRMRVRQQRTIDAVELRHLGLALEDLEHASDPACVLDRDLRISWVNPAWIAHGGGPEYTRLWGIGRTLTDAIHGPLRQFYAERLRACRAEGRPWYHHYECPTPEEARTWLMTVSPGPEHTLLLHHVCVASVPHPKGGGDVHGLGAPYRDWRGVVHQCGNCRQVQRPGAGGWTLVAPWIGTMPERAEQTLCPACMQLHCASVPRG